MFFVFFIMPFMFAVVVLYHFSDNDPLPFHNSYMGLRWLRRANLHIDVGSSHSNADLGHGKTGCCQNNQNCACKTIHTYLLFG